MTLSRRWLWAALLAGTLLVAVVVVTWLDAMAAVRDTPGDPPPALVALLLRPIADGPNAEVIRRGRALTVAGDCVGCHTRADGLPFAGGLGIKTPFGVIFSPNLTGDRATGIGAWTADEFARAMAHGIGRGGEHLYPAFPYTYFRTVTRGDDDAILAYLKTLPPVRYTPPANRLVFPVSLRPAIALWNAAFLPSAAVRPNRSPEWNRGAYLVDGLGHCGVCHTPKTVALSDKAGEYLRGGKLDHWLAPDLTGNPRTGLGRWSATDIVEYLRTARNARANAAGPMAEVVTYSTALMSDADLASIAAYLKTLPASPEAVAVAPDAGAMRRGAAIYVDACASCHLADGRGQPRLFPPLPGNAGLQQASSTTLLHVILAGARTGPTPARPTATTMPSFAWKLTDGEVADVSTYVRNAWGNRAAPVGGDDARAMRRALRLTDAILPRPR